MLCGQYLQSSGQAPVLMDNSVETCTALGLKNCRCTLWALNTRSLNGKANKACTSASVQSVRTADCGMGTPKTAMDKVLGSVTTRHSLSTKGGVTWFTLG